MSDIRGDEGAGPAAAGAAPPVARARRRSAVLAAATSMGFPNVVFFVSSKDRHALWQDLRDLRQEEIWNWRDTVLGCVVVRWEFLAPHEVPRAAASVREACHLAHQSVRNRNLEGYIVYHGLDYISSCMEALEMDTNPMTIFLRARDLRFCRPVGGGGAYETPEPFHVFSRLGATIRGSLEGNLCSPSVSSHRQRDLGL